MSRKHVSTKKHHQPNGGLKVVTTYSKHRGGGGGGCFSGDCQIATPNGTRAICDFAVGDSVLSYDINSGRTTERLITAVFEFTDNPLLEVVVGNEGRTIRVSPSHSLLTARGWLRADRLQPGNFLVSGSGEALEISAIQPIDRAKVFNLHTSGEHTFFADGVVAHNFTFLRSVRVWLHCWLLDKRRLLSRASSNIIEAT